MARSRHSQEQAEASRDAVEAAPVRAPESVPGAPGPLTPALARRLAPALGNQGLQRAIAAANTLQRAAVDTSGGKWDTTSYAARNVGSGVGKEVGADIELHFTPNDLVEGDKIGLTQSVKTLTNTAAGGAVDTPNSARSKLPDHLTAGEGDVGRGIDRRQFADGTLPETNPMYGTYNEAAKPASGATPAVPEKVSKSLGDTRAGGSNQTGSHKRKPDGTFEPAVDAILADGPTRYIKFDKQEYNQKFEVAALAIDGPAANAYLGTVEWGWKADASGTAALDPTDIKVVREGAPTSAFMDAAKKWNKLTFTDTATGTKHETVDLPITAEDAGALSTPDLQRRIEKNKAELAALAPAAPERARKELERAALEREMTKRADKPSTTYAAQEAAMALLPTLALLDRAAALPAEEAAAAGSARTDKTIERRAAEETLAKRTIKVKVDVHDTEDWTGADEVYVKATMAGKTSKTAVHSLNDGQSHTFEVSFAPLVPIAGGPPGAIDIEVFDEDLGGPDSDDMIVRYGWSRPFGKGSVTTGGGAKYTVAPEL